MIRLKIAVISLITFLIIIGTVNAQIEKIDDETYVYRIERATSFDFDVSQVGHEYTIFSVYLNDIAFNSTQTLLLDAYGKTYMLTITSWTEGFMGAWKCFYVNLTYPNGTTVSKQVTSYLEPFAQDYDVKVQYFVQQFDVPVIGLDVDIYISGLLDFQVVTDVGLGFTINLDYFLLFNRVQGTSTTEMNVEIFYTTVEQWQEYVEKGRSPLPFEPPTDVGSIWEMPENLWDSFLSAVEQIPVAGDYLATGLEFMTILVGETFYYIKLIFIENWEITVLTFEAFAMMYAIQSRNLMTMFRRYYSFHEKAFKLMFNIITGLLNLIWRLIQAVGSLIPFT